MKDISSFAEAERVDTLLRKIAGMRKMQSSALAEGHVCGDCGHVTYLAKYEAELASLYPSEEEAQVAFEAVSARYRACREAERKASAAVGKRAFTQAWAGVPVHEAFAEAETLFVSAEEMWQKYVDPAPVPDDL